jgi:hypothetical protein
MDFQQLGRSGIIYQGLKGCILQLFDFGSHVVASKKCDRDTGWSITFRYRAYPVASRSTALTAEPGAAPQLAISVRLRSRKYPKVSSARLWVV